jgi:hypothetical protein
MKTILILGNSKKFISVIKKNYREATIHVVGWRNLANQPIVKFHYSEIFLVGFDFDAIAESYKHCYQKNVLDVIEFLENVTCDKTIIKYVNTLISTKKTFSRYAYVKAALADELFKCFKNVYELQCPTIMHGDKVNIRGSRLTVVIAMILVKAKFINTIQLEVISTNFNVLWKRREYCYGVEGRFLSIVRPQIIDKFLRVALG